MPTNNDRKAMIQQGFDTVASGYDHPALSFFPETAKKLVEHLQLKPTDNLLDICTGTGVVALNAAQKLTQGKVTGIDLSSRMLEQAKSKAMKMTAMDGGNAGNAGAIGSETHCKIEFKQMDLDNLTIETGSFDVATCSFGLFFLEDMTRSLQNIANTVKPGGKVAITSFTGEAFSPMSDIFLKHYQETGKEAPPLSWKRLATKELLIEQFNAVGITDIKIHHLPLGYQMTSAQMWWDVVWNAGYRSLLNQLTDESQITFKKKHLKEITELVDDGIWFNTEVMIAIGVK